jgi:hypothetical protein
MCHAGGIAGRVAGDLTVLASAPTHLSAHDSRHHPTLYAWACTSDPILKISELPWTGIEGTCSNEMQVGCAGANVDADGGDCRCSDN